MQKNKHIARLLFSFFVLALLLALAAGAVPIGHNWMPVLLFSCSNRQGTYKDSIRTPEYIQAKMGYFRKWSFINYSLNYLEWTAPYALDHFFTALSHADCQRVRILHIGDSHVQADVYTGAVREGLQKVFGAGGRGFIFPYSMAKTNHAADYTSRNWGEWTTARNINRTPSLPLGLTGASFRTTDSSAGFVFRFLRSDMKANSDILKIFCRKSRQSFDISIKTNGNDTTYKVSCTDSTEICATLNLPQTFGDTIEITMLKTRPDQLFFECYGLLLESSLNEGIEYASVGINGAKYESILSQGLTGPQLQHYKPDLIIMDVGINEFYPGHINPEFETRMASVIDTLKKYAPEASFIIPCSQEVRSRKKKKRVPGVVDYAKIARQTAENKGAAFYNYFNITNRLNAFPDWYKNGLITHDCIHLTYKGYRTKGELLFNSILGTYKKTWLEGKSAHRFTPSDFPDEEAKELYSRLEKSDSLAIKSDTLEADSSIGPKPATSVEKSIPDSVVKVFDNKPLRWPKEPNLAQKQTKKTFHLVKKGESLGTIAQKEKVKIVQLKKWNHLKSDRIKAGMKLMLSEKESLGRPKSKKTIVKPTKRKHKPKLRKK